ncbi:MAG: ATP-binding cassette domain-containing protein [Burkholderiaceae bacterium]
MLRLQDLTLARGARKLYSKVTVLAPHGERIGLVGANGSGKSTLFAAILGELSPDAGDLETPPPARIAHVAQDIEVTDDSALDYVLAGHAPLMAARAALVQAEAGHDEMALAHAYSDLAELNEGAILAQARSILHGLGFSAHDGERRVGAFSGGWRNRLALARALMRPADLLLLDEPTNHLDLDSVVWLEAWLKRQPATVLLISHDREFLDRCITTTWAVEDETIRRYAGNYSDYETARIEQLRQQDAAARAYERTSAHLQKFIDRFRAQATKARQAQSRIKMLEKLQSVEGVRAKREWRFEFLEPLRLPEHLLDADNLKLGYGERAILDQVNFSVRTGHRIGILGVNGAGKSTLVKAIAAELAPLAGELRRGPGLAIGYFAQHQLDQLRGDESPLQHLRRAAPLAREQELRNFLGTYRFSGEMATTLVGPMSGGEKARLALALIAWEKPNVLLLDEPTNHLDMETRDALTLALSSFEGALIVVSHDRHLLRATAEQLWLVHDGRLAEFEGDLDDYSALVLASRREQAQQAKNEADVPLKRRDERRAPGNGESNRIAAARKPVQKKLEQTERELAKVSDELRELDARLADGDFYASGAPDEVAATLKRRNDLALKADALEAQWLELTEKLEAIR